MCSALSCSRLHLESAQIWPVCNSGITRFYQLPSHEPGIYSPATRRHRPLAGTHSPTQEGMARLSWPGLLVAYEIICPASGIECADTVAHTSTNRTRRRLTWLTETIALPLCQATTDVRRITYLWGRVILPRLLQKLTQRKWTMPVCFTHISLGEGHFATPPSKANTTQMDYACMFYAYIHFTLTSTFGPRAFSTSGPAAWNALSSELRDPSISLDCFRHSLKTYLYLYKR